MSDDKRSYAELLEDSAVTKMEVDDVHKPRMSGLKKIFKTAFGAKPKAFKFANDMIYFKGGYPKADSPPKAAKVFGALADYVFMLEAAGQKDKIDGYLRSIGLEVNRIGTYPNPYDTPLIANGGKLQAAWDAQFQGQQLPQTGGALLKKLFDEGQEVQCAICELSDEVKLINAAEAEADHGITKGPFMKAVGVRLAEMKKGDGAEKLQKIDENIEMLEKALEPLR